jgi:hypothetical protein
MDKDNSAATATSAPIDNDAADDANDDDSNLSPILEDIYAKATEALTAW